MPMQHLRFLLALSAFVVIGAAHRSLSAEETAPVEVIYHHAHVLTMNRDNAVCEAVAVAGGRIVKVGTNVEVTRLASANTRMVDLGGKTVLPGFIDGHAHPSRAVRMTEKYVDGRFGTTPSVTAVLAKISARTAQTPPGQWIIVAGSSSSQTRFAERRLPTRGEIDAAAPANPVMFLNGAHEAVVNTAGLQSLSITKGMHELKGARIGLDAQGEPTGVIQEGMVIFPDLRIPDQDLRRYYAKVIPEQWNAHGYTSVYAITPLQEMGVLRELATQDAPTLRYTIAVFTDPGGKFLPPSFEGLSLPSGSDANWYRVAGVKVWADSDVPMRGGAVSEPYAGPNGGHGLLNLSQDELDVLASRVQGAGLQFLVHATGDRATAMALTAFERSRATAGGKPLQRIEHFGEFMLGSDDLLRAQRLGIGVNVQPAWIATLANSTIENLGAERARGAFRFRSMIDAGLEPGFGTDVTGIVLETLDPFLHLWAAVARTSDVGTFVPAQAVSVTEALRMMTIWAARAQGEEDSKGSIEVGKLADMVVISEDVTAIAPAALRALKVLKTIVGGRVVYEAGGQAAPAS
ncbi:MAG: amidohydrolase [Deltaproteobacteria bacterium]|nr:amidohydrolase [Deltaproteobacteria bacterium]